jgi:uncharacterized protein YbjT (DUF2867 family)
MKILIIGGTRNISTPITRALLEPGHDLTSFNYDPQPPEWLRGVKVITGDRTHPDDFRARLKGTGPFDCVIDMICYEPEDARCDIELFRGRTGQFIFCSTVDVYTKTPQRYPVTEENFASVCRVTNGLRNARIGAIGARPAPFHTMRVSEQLLQASGITVVPVDLSEIIAGVTAMQEAATTYLGWDMYLHE